MIKCPECGEEITYANYRSVSHGQAYIGEKTKEGKLAVSDYEEHDWSGEITFECPLCGEDITDKIEG
jgi:predicted RNA-binding Zn-ribbon protein involved in translation (DUF1610 family)